MACEGNGSEVTLQYAHVAGIEKDVLLNEWGF